MEVTRSPDELFAAPTGRCLLGRVFAYWSLDPDLWGLTVWGQATRADVAQLADALRVEFRCSLPPARSVVDMRRLSSVDDDAFVEWARFLRAHRSDKQRRVVREVIVRPSAGLVASLLAGYLEVVDPFHPSLVTDSLTEGLAWLGRPDAAEAVDAIEALASGGPIEALRAALVPPFRIDSLDAAAGHLGVSRRTLQRHLGAAGTSFQAELAAARVRAAQALLLRSDLKLSAIASEVGFATQSHFTHVFRRVTGARPAEWRARAQRERG